MPLTALKRVLISAALLATPLFTYPANSSEIALEEASQVARELNLPIYVWRKDPEKKNYTAIVLAFHAFLLNGRRFNSIAVQLAEKNMLVVSIDARGFGQWNMSADSRRAGIDFKQSGEDALQVLHKLRKDFPGVPIVCMGESMGASSAIRLAVHSPNLIDGLILSSPCAIKERILLSKRALLDELKLVVGPCRQINLWPYLAQYGLENDLETVESMHNDPLVRSSMGVIDILKTMRMLEDSLRQTKNLLSVVPVFVIQGSQDRLCKLSKVKSVVQQIPGDQKEVLAVDGGGHLFLETDHLSPEIAEKVESWVNRIVSKSKMPEEDSQLERHVAFECSRSKKMRRASDFSDR